MSDQELRLNGPSRYTKQSQRLILEEYSHCEVPAGCGGVVLRWRGLDQHMPLLLRSAADNGRTARLAVDGQDTRLRSKLALAYGEHVLSLVIAEAGLRFALVLLAADLDPQYLRILQPEGDTALRTLPDGSWRATLAEPADEGWQRPGFDDAAWTPLVERPLRPAPRREGGGIGRWAQELLDQGARGLGLDPALARAAAAGRPTVYVRKVFRLAPRRPAE